MESNQALLSYTAPFLQEKLATTGMDETTYEQAFTEFKRFALLCKLSDKELAMTSPVVDQVWHQFILFTKEYHSFCERFLGRYLHHTPDTTHTPLDKQANDRFVTLYTQEFGTPSALWATASGCSGGNCSGK